MIKAYSAAYHKVKNKVRCADCGLFLCICKTELFEFGFKIIKPLKDVTYAQKVANCPHKCINSKKFCLDCFDFDKFKGVVVVFMNCELCDINPGVILIPEIGLVCDDCKKDLESGEFRG